MATVEIPVVAPGRIEDFGRNLLTKSYVFALGAERAGEVVRRELERLAAEHPSGSSRSPS